MGKTKEEHVLVVMGLKDQLVWSDPFTNSHVLIPTPFVWEGDTYQVISILNTMKAFGEKLQSCRLPGTTRDLHIVHFPSQVKQLAPIRDMFSDT